MSELHYSVIIPYYNKPYEISLILKALSKQDCPRESFEVVIIDDGSDEPINELVARYSKELNIHYTRLERLGIRGLIRNTGAENARAERLIFIDSDMIPERDFISQFDKTLGNNKNRIVLGWRYCLFGFEKEFIDEDVIEHNFEILASQVGLPDGRIIAVEHQQRTGRNTGGNWRQLHSHSFALYKELFFSVDGFDEEFSRNWGAEDVELGYRLEKIGAEILFNTKAISYHIEHPVDTNTQIDSLNENYRIFLKKHPHWDVELFSKEYDTLFPEQEAVVQKIMGKEFSLSEEMLPGNIATLIPQKTLLVGIDAPTLIKNSAVEASFYPESPINSDKIHNIIGFNTATADKTYSCVLVSAKYEQVNRGLFGLILEEMQRIAEQVIVCDVENSDAVVEALTNGTNLLPKPTKKVLFGLDNQLHHTYLTYSYRSLALACHKRGMEVGFQLMSDPWNSIDINSGFLRHGAVADEQILQEMRNHELRFLGDRVPCVLDTFAAEFFGQARGARILWEESFANNFSKKIARDIKYNYTLALSKRDDDHKILEKHVRCEPLTMGLDSDRIRKIKDSTIRDQDTFRFLWTDRFTNKVSSIDTLIDAFLDLYQGNEAVELQLLISNNHFPVNEVDRTFQSSSLFFHVSNMMIQKKKVCDEHLSALKKRIQNEPNISLAEEVYDIEEYTRFLAEADAFIHINAQREICPLVLEAVAMGIPTIVPDDKRYCGYIPDEYLINTKTEKVPMLFLDDTPDAFFTTRYYSYDAVLYKSLKESLERAHRGIESNFIPNSFQEHMLETYDWNTIAKQFEHYLELPEVKDVTA